MPSSDTIRRLALVRYLHGQGKEQGRKGELLAGLALLPLHDAVELFLRTAAEAYNVSLPRNVEFLGYWAAFDQAGKPLPFKARMERFNRSRVEAKHRGTLPNQHDLAAFQATVTEFLTVATRDLFGIEFENVSLSGLVKSEKVRSELEQAEQAFRTDDAKSALEHAALAFNYAMDGFRYGDPPRPWDKRLYNPTSTSNLLFHRAFDDSFARKVIEALNNLDDALTVVAYNIDYDGYRHLMTFGPTVLSIFNGNPHMQWTSEPTTDRNAIERCVDFAIEAALRLENAASRSAL